MSGLHTTVDEKWGRNRKRWTIIGITAVMACTAGALGVLVWWPRTEEGPRSTTTDIGRLPQVIDSLPDGFTTTSGEKVLDLGDVAEIKKSTEGLVTPAECGSVSADRADNLLGARMVVVNANKDGLFYMITAQEGSETSRPHTELPIDCSNTTVQYDNGYTITTSQLAPVVDEYKVEALRSVTKVDGAVRDSYLYRAWIDPRRVVTVIVVSDPARQPPSNPIDPTLAKQLFADAIRAVHGENND